MSRYDLCVYLLWEVRINPRPHTLLTAFSLRSPLPASLPLSYTSSTHLVAPKPFVFILYLSNTSSLSSLGLWLSLPSLSISRQEGPASCRRDHDKTLLHPSPLREVLSGALRTSELQPIVLLPFLMLTKFFNSLFNTYTFSRQSLHSCLSIYLEGSLHN